ncbi:MAG: GspE/PulE family protein [bacterium]|nr:GspE/PulE family protein [bacterium]
MNLPVIERDTDITELVRQIFVRAVAARASDVHIDPTPEDVRIRFRIDGAMVDEGTLPIVNLGNILTRLKVLAGLDIASRPVPQDGHCELEMDAIEQWARGAEAPQKEKVTEAPEVILRPTKRRVLDVRISIFPTVNGEAIVCRLLNRSDMLFTLDDLGMDPVTLKKVRTAMMKSYGMMLVTGPTGSGKTTTLYSIIRETMGKEKNIITLEDPVEYRIVAIRLVQMQPERGLTFAVGMKSILRQDPDVIMIGEIRDPETAEYAVRASLVGHNVFSTIHSNTTIGTVARLIDMNIERSLIAYALNGVISTRLVKKVCDGCKVFYMPADEYLKYFGLEPQANTFVTGKGCDRCNNTGYSGRIGIFEVLEFDNKLRAMIIDRVSMEDLQTYVEGVGMRTLKRDAIEKVLAGVTTIESVAHVV